MSAALGGLCDARLTSDRRLAELYDRKEPMEGAFSSCEIAINRETGRRHALRVVGKTRLEVLCATACLSSLSAATMMWFVNAKPVKGGSFWPVVAMRAAMSQCFRGICRVCAAFYILSAYASVPAMAQACHVMRQACISGLSGQSGVETQCLSRLEKQGCLPAAKPTLQTLSCGTVGRA
eukprot:6208125-Pleurochrysis_carterae.AAC.3